VTADAGTLPPRLQEIAAEFTDTPDSMRKHVVTLAGKEADC
jgi:hypothetical protein